MLHMAVLMGAKKAFPDHLQPFLVIHVCYCVNEQPFTDLANDKMKESEVLNKHCPTLYYPKTEAAKNSRQFFLTFEDFAARVISVGEQFWT